MKQRTINLAMVRMFHLAFGSALLLLAVGEKLQMWTVAFALARAIRWSLLLAVAWRPHLRRRGEDARENDGHGDRGQRKPELPHSNTPPSVFAPPRLIPIKREKESSPAEGIIVTERDRKNAPRKRLC
jgi:hypothetical protein